MGRKLTAEIVNGRIADRGIVMVGDYVGARSKSTFQCTEGHAWDAAIHSVMYGRGCPDCFVNGLKSDSEAVKVKLADRGIEMMGEYKNTHTKTLLRCNNGHEWETTPAHALRDTGCPYCAGNVKLTKELVNERIAGRSIEMIGDYITARSKSLFRCDDGHEWLAIPDSVLRGTGCPDCCNIATDADVIYLWGMAELPNHYKVGITSQRAGDNRINQVARKANVTPMVIRQTHTEKGKAREIEQTLLELGRAPSQADLNIKDGRTEVRVFAPEELLKAIELIDAAA